MRRLNLSLGMLVAVILPAAGMVTATPAMAANVSSVYRDCETNGQLTGHYSRALLQAALNDMPSQLAEYSGCQAIIQHSLLAASRPSGGQHNNGSTTGSGSGGGTSGGGGGQSGHNHSGATGTARHRSGDGSGSTGQNKSDVTVGTSNIHPASAGSAARSLPAVLVVVLILLVLTALSGGALAIRRRVAARHGT